jgi:hypothetical protein
MKQLKLQRTTLRNLNGREMSEAAGGTIIIRRSVIIACVPVTIIRTAVCPSAVDGCPSAPGGCTTDTILTDPGTSVINPGGGGF